MNQGKLVFAQVMEHLPLTTFRRPVARYRGASMVKGPMRPCSRSHRRPHLPVPSERRCRVAEDHQTGETVSLGMHNWEDTLTDEQVRDLIAYIRSATPHVKVKP